MKADEARVLARRLKIIYPTLRPKVTVERIGSIVTVEVAEQCFIVENDEDARRIYEEWG